ncbi:C39 family peptidase [Planotetraspora sp. A-T 1434]|nr:papain-like cysteine protease family protein [Planotetraspora sp. A-T 1434]MCT9928966.1 C39 family peptidase [Planotetraspora sp. A-T 1434]
MVRRSSGLFQALAAVTIAGTCLFTPGTAQAAQSHILPVDMQTQEQSKWCWSAAGSMIAAYHGVKISQNDFCNLAKDKISLFTCPNEAGSAKLVAHALDKLSFYSPGDDIHDSLTYQGVQTQINAKRPFYVGISWASGGGHALVAYGYDTRYLGGLVYYINPKASGARRYVRSYTGLVSNSSFTWTRTLNNIMRSI